jgi:hypothetical protein
MGKGAKAPTTNPFPSQLCKTSVAIRSHGGFVHFAQKWPGRLRPAQPEFSLYHAAANLSSLFCKINFFIFFPKTY